MLHRKLFSISDTLGTGRIAETDERPKPIDGSEQSSTSSHLFFQKNRCLLSFEVEDPMADITLFAGLTLDFYRMFGHILTSIKSFPQAHLRRTMSDDDSRAWNYS